ncbi:DNA-protecting protein DprA [Corynebacterium sp. 4HC-13]|uniref:DNA-processing protein DprA n=1 Tax=Corynebacterium anserum TaxID=2684406 RepID=UPI00163AF140|nr:DNA-processing protein DprA [Corynebacterium anserum]MBC2681772.1 DNA-protecting protein DprA [Corynebacterium anserum]
MDAADSGRTRVLAWAYLRRVVEGSTPEILDLLWPHSDDEVSAGWSAREGGCVGSQPMGKDRASARVVEVARRIYRRDTSLPDRVLMTTERRWNYDPTSDVEQAEQRGMRLLTPDSDEWPCELTQAFLRMADAGADNEAGVRGQASAPFALWVRGEVNLATVIQHSVTVVGTRAATRYGRNTAYQLCSELAGRGYTIVSGGAYGIDKQAHCAALDNGAPTIALLASGVDVAYPKKHRELFDRIVDSGGLLISEYAPGTPPARHRFLTRNRLAAALSQATVMVEAPIRSGAMNTMNWAEAMVKPTLAVPGPIDSAASQGCLLRIQEERAALVRTVADVVNAIEPVGRSMTLWDEDTAGGQGHAVSLSWQETAVYDAVGIVTDTTGTVEDIQQATGLAPQVIVVALRLLREKGVIDRQGQRWVKVLGKDLRQL